MQRLLVHVGWPEQAVRPVTGRAEHARLLQVQTAGEPRVLIAIRDAADSEQDSVGLGYSREAPYTFWWHDEGLGLVETTRWHDVPGDAPLALATAGDLAQAEDLLSLLRPESITLGRPSRYAEHGKRHHHLHELLAEALWSLRQQVVQSAFDAGHRHGDEDDAVLRLFHQLLFVRFQEDRGEPASPLRIIGLREDEQPQQGLASLLADYERKLNSDLFEPTGIRLEALPTEALEDLFSKLVEPWSELRLNFSVTRSEIAGRLYQSYLRRSPSLDAKRKPAAAPTLFPLVEGLDERERQASYYTPPGVARQLARQTLGPWLDRHQPSRPEDVRVLDPACGSGAFLLASFRLLLDYFESIDGSAPQAARREEILRHCIFGADIDRRALGLAQIQLLEEARLPRRRLPQLDHNLLPGDSLAAPPGWDQASDEGPRGIQWARLIEERGKFSCVLANPPFGAQVSMPRRLSSLARSEARLRFPEVTAWGSDWAYLFVALALRLVDEDGAVGFVLPRTVLDGVSARAAREELNRRSITSIVDYRGLNLFTGANPYVSTVSLGSAEPTIAVAEVADSRDDMGLVLEELTSGSATRLVRRSTVPRARLAGEIGRGWSAFRLRWFHDLERLVGRTSTPFAPRSGRGERLVVQGTQPGALERFVLEKGAWRQVRGRIEVDGVVIPRRCAPRYVRGEDIRPFAAADTGRRLFVPFDDDGKMVEDDGVVELLRKRGGRPSHPQPGDLTTLRGRKVLVRGFAREPAAVADPVGDLMTIKGTGGGLAVRIPGATRETLEGVTALLNSTLYQWLLRGFGRPRSDETIELLVSDVADLPWPRLSEAEWSQLARSGADVLAAHEVSTLGPRIQTYWEARRRIDEQVLDLLEVQPKLREVIGEELVRPAYG
jgi:N-6 DNA Methylase